ncbi:hypothetical protein HHI36_000041 [Cryptolaemus montrouzieri]|uniref:Endonuclease/exonuclease/phosphatase domain-containing protein n=1 Tax=Cryptolaemus montrouzieri TaxID=559131 RepID=A0ABD2P3W3_9CUCU
MMMEDDPEIGKFSEQNHIEIAADISRRVPLIVVSVYRPPQGDISVCLDDGALKRASSFVDFRIVLCGDFNIHLDRNSDEKNMFLDLLHSYGFIQKIHEPTYQINEYSSHIDNIFLNSDMPKRGRVIANGLSPHNAQVIDVPLHNENPSSPSKPGKRKIFTESKKMSFKEELSNVDKQKPWITVGIKTSSRHKMEIYKKKIEVQVSDDFFRAYSGILRRVVRQAKKMYNEECILRSKNKNFPAWNLIRIHSNGVRREVSILEELSGVEQGYQEVLNDINTFFVNQGSESSSNMMIRGSKALVWDKLVLTRVAALCSCQRILERSSI